MNALLVIALIACLSHGIANANTFQSVALSKDWQGVSFYAISWTDSGSVLATGHRPAAGSIVLQSADSGQTWTEVYSTSTQIKAMAGRTLDDVDYAIAVDSAKTVHIGHGNAWSTVSTAMRSAAAMYGAAIGANGNAFVAGSFNFVFRSTVTSLSTWTAISPITSAPAESIWYDISTHDGEHVILIGAGGRVMASADAGMTWSAGDSGTNNAIFCLAHADNLLAMAAGMNGYLAKTTDGGSTWTAMSAFDSSYSALYNTISMLSPSEAYVAAAALGESAGVIYRTVDGGDSWSLLAETKANLFSLAMFSATQGVAGAAGAGGLLALLPEAEVEVAV